MKSNRKALLTSVVSLLICVTMLIGTTFAWFTDTASTSVSRIQAGTLKVQLWSANVTNCQVGEFKNVGDKTNDAREPIFSAGTDESPILWEPGYTAYRVITIKNTGNLAFEFALDVTRADGQTPTNLPEAIDAYYKVVDTVPTTIDADAYKTYGEATPLSQIIDSTDSDGVVYGRILPANSTATPVAADLESKGEITVILALHMKETAGNEYMNLTEKFDIKVYAKQWTEEYDSNGNQYDKDAEYDAERTPDTEEPACEHTNTKLVSNGDATHNKVCAAEGCGEVIEENVNCTYTDHYVYGGQPDSGLIHVHKSYCECGDYVPEDCTPQEGQCTVCGHNAEHQHTYTCGTNYVPNNNNTHNEEYACTSGGTMRENVSCVDDDNDKKCDLCDGVLTIAPTSLTFTVHTNTPGLSGLTYELKYDDAVIDTKTADANGDVEFTVTGLSSSSQYGDTFHYTFAPKAVEGVTFVERDPADVYINVYYSSMSYTAELSITGEYATEEYSNSFTYNFSGETIPTVISTNFGTVADGTCTLESGVLHVGTYNDWGYSCNHDDSSSADNPPTCNTGYSRWNQWSRPEFDLGTLSAGTYTVSCKLMAKDIKSSEHTPNYNGTSFNGTYTYVLKQEYSEFGFRILLNDNEQNSVVDTEFTQGEWKTLTLTFTLTEDTVCKVQVDTHIDFSASYRFDFYLDDFTVIKTSN